MGKIITRLYYTLEQSHIYTGRPIKIVLIFKFFADFWIFSVKELKMAVLVIYHAPIKYRLTRGEIFQFGPPWPE